MNIFCNLARMDCIFALTFQDIGNKLSLGVVYIVNPLKWNNLIVGADDISARNGKSCKDCPNIP